MESKEQLLVDLQYFGDINYYIMANRYSHVIFDVYQPHQKRGFSNRTVILGANGKISLSVPLEKGRSQRTIFKEVVIANTEEWQTRHWRSIVSSYNNSPWFKYLSDSLSVIYFKKFHHLLDLNLACVDWTLKILGADWNYELTTERTGQIAGVDDWRFTNFSGSQLPSGVRYPQVFENKFGFVPNLSILDLIFCEGPKGAVSLLKRES